VVQGAARPNVLFIIADDASRSFGEAYGCSWAKTPHIDKLAKAGLVFDHAYTPTSKCAPSRAAIMTGRNPWQLEDAANHQPSFPTKFITFTEALNKAGIATGSAGKTWGPGAALNIDGSPRSFALGGPGFAQFLKGKPQGAPFFYWFGSKNPHRPYQLDAGLAAGKKPADISHVPGYWPDNEEVRRDMLDYATEIEAYDAEVGELLTTLEASGQAANTLIIVTSDHGMPFPRVKGHTIDEAHHIPLIASWPAGLATPGRVADLVSFIDLAPTLLELFEVDGIAQGMSPITGRSFTDLLRGKATTKRDFLIIGRERNDVLARPGTPSGLGYPTRGLREGNFLFVHNYEPDRWPCGNEEIGFTDTDNSPTKSLLMALGASSAHWQFAFGKRPADELYDLVNDPDCVQNLAADPAHAARVTAMQAKLTAELTRQADPRVLGQGAVFDQYLSPKALIKPKKKGKAKPLP
jgi:N-sulfoglucosamine sulfohydrolase